ncbi:integrase family protein [Craterilacuibacter sp. RT1T]|uniref:integrase family protein n=1 Tax=Craterilacuibacter sp. RT1T TaxID=2942211 RepID=UPI0020C023AC|nr:integrase family protein [Craterilacuibacter sp. RT1T]MCL6264464.1 integrase family protein [Craterilacuibacter sp. RT1T]
MARVLLTINRIEKLTCPANKSQVFLRDSEVPGFGIRCTQNRKTFIFEADLHGKSIRITIGEYPAWLLDAPKGSAEPSARRRARELRGLIDQGIDPREQDRHKKEESERQQAELAKKNISFEYAWSSYIKANAIRWSNTHLATHERLTHRGGEPRVRSKVKETIPGPLASLLDVCLRDLTSDRLAVWLDKENITRPTVTALAFRMLRAYLNWCDEQPEFAGLVPDGAHAAKKVRQRVSKSKAKDDCLQREQLASWFAAMQQLNPVFRAYLQTLLLTGARREELAKLCWSDVDFQWNSMRLSDKVESERTIPLTPYVASLLTDLPRVNEWVFSSPTARSGRIQDPRDAHNRALASAGLPNLTLHGLRRSFGTLAEWVECPAGVVAQIQGHKPSATAEKHYRRRPLDLLRMWHIRIENWFLEQAGLPTSTQ